MATSVTNANTSKRGGLIFQTNNSDLTNAVQFQTKANAAYQVRITGTAFRAQDDTQAGAYSRRSMFRTDANGVVTQVGASQTPEADLVDAGGWLFQIVISGTKIVLQVSGTGSPVYWNIDWRVDVADTVPQA